MKNRAKSHKTTSCLLDWEFSHLGFWKAKAYSLEKSQILGLFLSISWFYLFKKSEEKESYFEGVKK